MGKMKYLPKLKDQVVLEPLSGDRALAGICKQYGVPSTQLSKWRIFCTHLIVALNDKLSEL